MRQRSFEFVQGGSGSGRDFIIHLIRFTVPGNFGQFIYQEWRQSSFVQEFALYAQMQRLHAELK